MRRGGRDLYIPPQGILPNGGKKLKQSNPVMQKKINCIKNPLIKLQVQKVHNPKTNSNKNLNTKLAIPHADQKMKQLNDLLELQIDLKKQIRIATELLRKHDSLVPEIKRSFASTFGFTGSPSKLKILDKPEIRKSIKEISDVVSKLLNLMIKLTNGASPEKDVEDTPKQQDMIVQKSLYSAFA